MAHVDQGCAEKLEAKPRPRLCDDKNILSVLPQLSQKAGQMITVNSPGRIRHYRGKVEKRTERT